MHLERDAWRFPMEILMNTLQMAKRKALKQQAKQSHALALLRLQLANSNEIAA